MTYFPSTLVLGVAAGLLALRLAAELALGALNRAAVRRGAAAPPPAVAAVMDAETLKKTAAYTLEKSRFGSLETIFETLVLALVVFGGILPAIYDRISAWGTPGAAWTGALFILLAGLLLALPSLPFDWWAQFRLEAKFGFNRGTPALWLTDRLKGAALAGGIGFPVLWALLALARMAGAAWWLWGAALVFGFQLLMLVLYPRLILPLFNKLERLPEGELRSRLLALGDRTGFAAAAIEVMDGGKRSGHSNAFFTGFGRFRRIVLFDTLIAQLEPVELEAVLAHEIGHYRRGHIPKHLALAAAMLLAGFAVVAWLARSPWFNLAFGFPPGEMAPAFLLFGLLGGSVTFWLAPLSNRLSRKHEYEADAFARDAMDAGGPMIAALRTLARENLSNPTPHPWFSAFFYSHPTLAERERALAPPHNIEN
jgi:STE24 endopeptidase